MEKKTLLDRAARTAEERTLLAHVLDKCEQCRTRNVPAHTDFLSPAEQRSAADLLHAAAIHDGYVFLGGYASAERRMLCFLPQWQEEAEDADYMTALCCTLRAEDGVTHRDLLGSLMGLSITRGKIGDILVTPELAQVIVSADIAEYLLTNWTSAGRARLRVEAMALDALEIPEQKVREIRDTVATLRLDAVTASGFSISRARAAELIASGRVQKNYRETTKPDAPVAQGDVISARGVGKFELSEVGGLSRKGRTAILLRRYL